jgi:protein-disulfide isomerase
VSKKPRTPERLSRESSGGDPWSEPGDWSRLAAIAALSALWSLFLWAELALSRAGAGSFCGFGAGFDCTAVWNGRFATAVHDLTGLPVAGWGLVWSAAAFVAGLAGLSRLAAGREPGPWLVAARLAGAAAGAGVIVLLAVSVASGSLCVGCIGTYLLAAGYAAITLWRWRAAGFAEAGRGLALSLGSVLVGFLVLLYPGLHTPKKSGEAGRQAVAAAASAAAASEGPASAAPTPEGSSSPATTGTGDASRDRALQELVTALDPAQRQMLADSLAIYRNSRPAMLLPPRSLTGSSLAPVRVTEFTDILCEHCAALYETLQTLREHTAPGSYAVDARQFPLDGRCNPVFEPRTGDDVRCVAATARICMEPTGHEPEFAGVLFANQKDLTAKKVLELAAPFMERAKLSACMASPATTATLQQDEAAASQFDSDGTPIVAINGRKGTSYGPFLYAIILTRGDADHPAFAELPPGNPAAHMH